ncbi:hypothetical protein [uncultured Bacteroides sp.]|uniref:hypothetical protein n=1 Tax=uncultured Bacteroides sp. TaxID=162156 RepID=UPI002AAA8F30|nr:hypothetical protein [uncultured Bacteroides sp.]
MKKDKSIEQRTADAIMQKEQEVNIGGTTYKVAPPTTATLMETSILIAKMPRELPNKDNIVMEALRLGKYANIVGQIIATIILGEKNLFEDRIITKRYLFVIKKTKKVRIDKREELTKTIIQELRPSKLSEVLANLLLGLEVSDFFGVTTSLIEINILKPTKK